MALTSAGATLLAQCLISDGPTFANTANAYLGVGDSSATQSATLTDLQASTNKLRKAMMTGYPQRVGSELTFKAAFSEGAAEYKWEEWATFNAAAAGTMITRKVEALGTKGVNQVWTLTVAVTFTTSDAT